MNFRRSALAMSLFVGAGVVIFFLLRDGSASRIAWEKQLLERESVCCVSTREGGARPILVAGIQQNNYGSRDYDNYIVCFDLSNGDEIWRRRESEVGNLRGGKRPTSIDFDPSGDLIVGWDYFAVGEGDFKVVSKLFAKDGTTVWEWRTPSDSARSPGTGDSHGAWVFCDGPDIVVRTERAVEAINGNSGMEEIYSVIHSTTGVAVARTSSSTTTAEARSKTRENSLEFIASDGSKVTWGIHTYENTHTNWFRWHKEDGIWMPESHWEKRERVQVTQISPSSPKKLGGNFIGREKERVTLLLYKDGEVIPSAALLIDMGGEIESRKWRVVQVSNGRTLGRTLAHGTGISHNYTGPIRLTNSGSIIMSGAMLQNQGPQKIIVWK